MNVQAEISLYPLRQNHLSEPIRQFTESLEGRGLSVRTGAMSSIITGDSDTVFNALRDAFETAAEKYQLVLTVKISNACPKCQTDL